MDKTVAIIRKVGDKYCVFSESGKNLGCSTTRQGAEKRLQQVEHFKNKGSSNMNYDNAFDNFTKALHDIDPTEVGKAPEASPREIDVESETLTVSDTLQVGSIASRQSDRLLDTKDHFPVFSQVQAQSSMARVMQLNESPSWYNGSIAELRQEVYNGIMNLHPEIELNIRVPVEQTTALSDGEEASKTTQQSIEDPMNTLKKDNVPQVGRPTLTSAQVVQALEDEETRKAISGRLMEMVDKQIDHLKTAKKVATRLLKSGLKAEEFDQMSTYVQEDILRELVSRGVNATATDRRRELLDRLSRKED
jgi:hypothetical protein